MKIDDDDKDTIPPRPGKNTGDMIDTPFPPEELPEDVLRRLEEAGVLQPTSRSTDVKQNSAPSSKPPSSPPAKAPSSAPRPPPSKPKAVSSPHKPPPAPPKSPPPAPKKVDPKQDEFKTKLRPLIPNMQKLLRLISGGSILPSSVSFENVRLDGNGIIYIGQLDIGKIFEGMDGDGISVRIYLEKLNVHEEIPEIIKKSFPVSESILAINKKKTKFFIITEKDISLGFAKSEVDASFLYIIGRL